MNDVIRQKPTFVRRTYRGGAMLRAFLGIFPNEDSFYPEDWISSFQEAKNKDYVENEGITVVETENGNRLITDVVAKAAFGEDRTDPGVLIKFLDAGERLGIQVHPTRAFAKRVFNVEYGKTESWYILDTRTVSGENACIYIGFREFVTKEVWADLFRKQDIAGMLNAMHRFEVKKGDAILVTGGTPHAIGAGCFLMEVQEPSDYTMRVEKVTVAGERLTEKQIHYGAGEEALLDCFEYIPMTREEAKEAYFIVHEEHNGIRPVISYDDTPFFAYSLVNRERHVFRFPHFVTVIALEKGGTLTADGKTYPMSSGDRFFISAGTSFKTENARVMICCPPEKSGLRRMGL